MARQGLQRHKEKERNLTQRAQRSEHKGHREESGAMEERAKSRFLASLGMTSAVFVAELGRSMLRPYKRK
jgi:hypothetical protein